MKVHRRGTFSPSLLQEAEPPTSVNGTGNYYSFELETYHVERGKRGQKVFVCDLCPAPAGVFKRSFSLKRHYLRFHINFAFLSPRDLNNCAIAVAGQQQRSGSGAPNGNGRVNGAAHPLLYRCHQCGCLLRSKPDLVKHLKTHPDPSTAPPEEVVVEGDQRGKYRCQRCSTAFSLRKTLMRHIKKNRCRGGGGGGPTPPSNNESETAEVSDPAEDPEESEEMDMEASLKLGCPTSMFRFACTLCSKMFNSYVNMCRHRRLAHGRYGICSPHWLQSRKSSTKCSLLKSVPSPVKSSQTLLLSNQVSQDYSHFIHNVKDNLNQFIDGKRANIRSTAPLENEVDGFLPQLPTDRFSWGETSYTLQELCKLDMPLQLALHRGLKKWKLQEEADKLQSSQPEEQTSITSALDLQPAATSSCVKIEKEMPRPELSGEWTRKKRYICLPCGQLFRDFLVLLDHQQALHGSVLCRHIQLDQSMSGNLVDELTRQIKRSGNGEAAQNDLQCTKCHESVDSVAELHSHILLCSNHVSASPYRRRRTKPKPISRKCHWRQNGRSAQKNPASATRSLRGRSPKEDSVDNKQQLRRTRRVLAFPEKKGVVKRLLRQRADPNEPVKAEVSKKKIANGKTPIDLLECEGCQKTFLLRSSLLKHKYYCPNRFVDESKPVEIVASPKVAKKSKLKTLAMPEVVAVKQPIKSKKPILPSESSATIESGSKSSTPKRVNGVSARAQKKVSAKPSTDKSKSKSTGESKQNGIKRRLEEEEATVPVKSTPKVEDEEVSVATSRPIRSSRKMPLVMEDQVEASFLEALSPEQRVKVAEQKCPFCSKHYKYRSYFRKHLLEGCEANGDEDLPVAKTLFGDSKKQTGKASSNATPKASKTKKEPQQAIPVEIKEPAKKKKAASKTEETKAMPQEKKVSKEKKQVKTKTVKEEPPRSSKKANGLVKSDISKKKDVKKAKSKKVLELKRKKSEPKPQSKKEESKRDKLLNNSDKAVVLTSTISEPANLASQEKNGAQALENHSTKIDIARQIIDSVAQGDVSQTQAEEMNGSDSNVNSWKRNKEPNGIVVVNGNHEKEIHQTDGIVDCNGKKQVHLIIDTENTNGEISCNNSESPIPSPEIFRHRTGHKTHAIDRFRLGQALNNAIISGVFKPYSSLTKYPTRMRQLSALAQAYCEKHAVEAKDDDLTNCPL